MKHTKYHKEEGKENREVVLLSCLIEKIEHLICLLTHRTQSNADRIVLTAIKKESENEK